MLKASNHTEQQLSPSLSTSSMPSNYEMFSLTFLILETVIGILVNGYIVFVNLMDLVTRRKLGSGDIILTCLSSARFGFQMLVLGLYVLTFFFSNQINSQSYINSLQYVWLFFHNISAWLAAFICTFYCVKIVNIQQWIFVFLKTHFDRCVPFFIIASLGISALCSNSYAYSGLNNVINMSKFERAFANNTSPFILGGSDFATFSIIAAVSIVPPFLLFCFSTGMVVGSLLKHMSNVKAQERTGFREPSLNAHYKAVIMMGAFFIFFSLYTLSFNLYVSGASGKGMGESICTMIIGAYPSLHSCVFAIGNPKLKKTFIKILRNGLCYQAQMSQIETIDS